MTIEEANKMLDSAPVGDSPSAINPSLTQAQAVDIVRKGINSGTRAFKHDGINLDDLMEKRVYQVCRNQRRPRYS